MWVILQTNTNLGQLKFCNLSQVVSSQRKIQVNNYKEKGKINYLRRLNENLSSNRLCCRQIVTIKHNNRPTILIKAKGNLYFSKEKRPQIVTKSSFLLELLKVDKNKRWILKLMAKKCRVVIHKTDAIAINKDSQCSKLAPKFHLNMIRDHQIQARKRLPKLPLSLTSNSSSRHHTFLNGLSTRQNLLDLYLPPTSLFKQRPPKLISFILILLSREI